MGVAASAPNSQSSGALAGSVIFLPICYEFVGFILGLITVLVYNLVAWVAGGIEIELEETRCSDSATYQQ